MPRGRRLILTAALLFALAPAASAKNGVRVQINGGGVAYLTADEVDNRRDVPTDTMATRRDPGGAERLEDAGGTKLSTVLALAGLPDTVVREVVVPHVSDTGQATITGDQVRNGFNTPSDGLRYATIYTGYGPSVRFFRPQALAGDENGLDVVTTTNNGDLVLRVATDGPTRSVVAHVDNASPDPGTTVGFTASVENPDGQEFTYRWDFDDGTASAAQTPTHAFAAGRYAVTVTAVGRDGSAGVSAPIELQVGAAATPTATPTVTATATATPTATATKGPGKKKSGQKGGGEGDEKSRATGPKKSKGNGEERKSDPTPTPTATATATATAAPTVAATATATTTPVPTATASPPEPAPTATPAPSPGATPAPTPAGEQVEGVVLAGSGDVTEIIAAARAQLERAPARRGEAGGGAGTLAAWAGGSGVLIGLLALGVALEGGFRRRR